MTKPWCACYVSSPSVPRNLWCYPADTLMGSTTDNKELMKIEPKNISLSLHCLSFSEYHRHKTALSLVWVRWGKFYLWSHLLMIHSPVVVRGKKWTLQIESVQCFSARNYTRWVQTAGLSTGAMLNLAFGASRKLMNGLPRIDAYYLPL